MGSQWWFCCVWFLCFALVICIYFFFSFFIQPLFEATSVVSSQPSDFTIISGTLPRHCSIFTIFVHLTCPCPDLCSSTAAALHYKGGKHLFDTCLIKTCCHKRFHPLAGGGGGGCSTMKSIEQQWAKDSFSCALHTSSFISSQFIFHSAHVENVQVIQPKVGRKCKHLRRAVLRVRSLRCPRTAFSGVT